MLGVQTVLLYLYGSWYTLCADHNSFQWILKLFNALRRPAQWRLRLAELEYDVEYRPGVKQKLRRWLLLTELKKWNQCARATSLLYCWEQSQWRELSRVGIRRPRSGLKAWRWTLTRNTWRSSSWRSLKRNKSVNHWEVFTSPCGRCLLSRESSHCRRPEIDFWSWPISNVSSQVKVRRYATTCVAQEYSTWLTTPV